MISLIKAIVKLVKAIFGIKNATKILNILTRNEQFYYLENIYNPNLGGNISRLVIFLPGKGCAWARKSGGCTMCGFYSKIENIHKAYRFSSSDLTSLCEIALILNKNANVKEVAIFNGGSFLNTGEISISAQKSIVKMISRISSVERLFVESRPEFVNEENISIITIELGKKQLMIGIGLEAVTDSIREVNIHKGFNLEDYQRAVRAIKNHNVQLLTYVFLKPIGLTEKEAIQEAVNTIQYAFESGSQEVALESAFVQKNTVMAQLYQKGEYKPPWLWSIIEVIKQTKGMGFVFVGNFSDEPPPIAIPCNCSECSSIVMKALQLYRETYHLEHLTSLTCTCKIEWQKEISKK